MQLRVFLTYKFFEPHPMLKNEWNELKSWNNMNETEQRECQWPWISNLRDNKSEPEGIWEYVGTEIPGDTFHALRQVVLKQIRLSDVEMAEKKGMAIASTYWHNEDGFVNVKKKKDKTDKNSALKMQFFVSGTDIELVDPEDKIHNKRRYTVNVYLKKTKARAA